MPNNVAISVANGKAYLLAGEKLEDQTLVLKESVIFDLPELIEDSEEEIATTPSTEDIESILGIEVDSTSAILESDRVLIDRVTLPFLDSKQIDRVLPLQIQDKVPFDVDDFAVDSLVSGAKIENEYEFLSSMVPKLDVKSFIERLELAGIEPALVTSRSFALTGIRELAPNYFPENFVLLDLQKSYASMAIIFGDNVLALREYNYRNITSEPALVGEIIASLTQAELIAGKRIDEVCVLGSASQAKYLSGNITWPVKYIQAKDLVVEESFDSINLDEFISSLGLLGLESSQTKLDFSNSINFRKGEFAFKPTLGNIISSLKENSFYLLSAIVTGLVLLAATVFSSLGTLGEVEDIIAKSISKHLPGELVPYRREKEFLQDKVSALEDELRGLGSLASLSPLNSLRELSTTVEPSIDTLIDTLNIANARIFIKGSVPDIPTVGRLESALESNKKQFCDVSVEPKGRQSGTNRSQFSADIELCE